MEMNSKGPMDNIIIRFKSHYVVWKLISSEKGTYQGKICLNRTM